MKKLFLFILLPLFTIIGCSDISSQTITRVIYSDKPTITEGDVSLTFSDIKELQGFSSDVYNISFSISFVSSNPKPIEYKISYPKFIREANNAEYSLNNFLSDSTTISLECDVPGTCYISTTLPTSPSNENYYLSFNGNGIKYQYCLYETPDEFRTKYSVKYVVDGVEVKAVQIPERRKLSNYDWVSTDYVYGCNEWYFDPSFSDLISDKYTITNDLTIYGQKKTILKYLTPNGMDVAYVNGYNFIPSNGEIVIPKAFSERPIYGILAGSFRDEVKGMKAIYIPHISLINDSYNFTYCKDLETVYYEGTEAEWDSINQATFRSNVTFIFNTYK